MDFFKKNVFHFLNFNFFFFLCKDDKKFFRVKRCQGTERGNFKSFIKKECDDGKVFVTKRTFLGVLN